MKSGPAVATKNGARFLYFAGASTRSDSFPIRQLFPQPSHRMAPTNGRFERANDSVELAKLTADMKQRSDRTDFIKRDM